MRILLPVDGSDAALDAVRHVLDWQAAGLALDVVLLNVQDAPHLYEVVLVPDVEVLAAAGHEAAEDAMDPAREMLAAAEVDLTCVIAAGDAGHRIVETAEEQDCDQIVMGSQGVGLLGRARLGTVCQWVLTHAAVPVTVVRHHQRDADADDEPAGLLDGQLTE